MVYGLAVWAATFAAVGVFVLALRKQMAEAREGAVQCLAQGEACKQYKGCAAREDPAGCIAAKLQQQGYNYNVHHWGLCILPTLVYLVLRNATPWYRQRASSVFVWLGRRSLEIYLLQYHLWLANDAKTILEIIPGAPLINAGVAMVGFIAAAHIANRCTSELSTIILS
mmetsp:Transcript_5781/g.13868  ORF Transcript_5781/g.13868 Transcript_5781/m.13868 type:complete len:169 (-) Transcript_5781:81-587(-)